MLLMGTYGALGGALVGSADELDTATLIEQAAGKLVEGEYALIAFVEEKSEDALDAELGKYDVSIVRFDAAAIAQEVEEAIETEKEMEREAKLRLRAEKKAERKEKIEERREKMKAGFEEFKKKVSE